MSRYKTQDPKYDIEDGKLINAATGVPIPPDEPVFILRGKDRRAMQALEDYVFMCNDDSHVFAVMRRIDEFEAFADRHPDRMKEPDTQKRGGEV